MILTLDIVSDNPQLNSFTLSKVVQFASGDTPKVIMRLWNPNTNIRYIPSASAVITVALQKSDNTILNKTCSFTFADDRSIIEFSLTAVESAAVISQNIVAKITDGADVKQAVLQYGLQRVVPDGSC
jgi:endonuclease YncB( thermonuclease family)